MSLTKQHLIAMTICHFRRKVMENKNVLKDEIMGILEDSYDKMVEAFLEKEDISEEDKEIIREKFRVEKRHRIAKRKLDEVTDNTYIGVTKILNEKYNKIADIYEEAYKEIKQYLEDNNLPFKEEFDEESEEEFDEEIQD